jgi:hypothetical protein
MTKPMVRIHNVQTGEIVDREMNATEFAQYEAEQADRIAKEVAKAAKDEAKAALLERLGITADEAALLLG